MKQCEKVAYNYLISKYRNVELKGRTFVADGHKFRAKRVYGKTVWLYPHELEEMKMNNIDLIAVDKDRIHIIESYNLDKNIVVDGIKIKCPEKIKIALRLETVERLRKYTNNFDEFINSLLDRFELASVSVPGISNEMLPIILAVSVAKNNRIEYYDALYRLMNGRKVENEQILNDLAKYKVIYRDAFTDEISLLAWFEHKFENGKVKITVAYNDKFCRTFCSSVSTCPLFKNQTGQTWFGNVFEFTIEEFERNTVDELIGKCIMRCIPYDA